MPVCRRLHSWRRPARALGFVKATTGCRGSSASNHSIDLTRWQAANCYTGRAGLINLGGASSGQDDLSQAVRTAVINKLVGGTGLIVGCKPFQRPMAEGAALIHAVQDVHLDNSITITSWGLRSRPVLRPGAAP